MESAIKVTSSVPLPEGIKPGRNIVYPWDDMKHGDSFVVPAKRRNSAHASFSHWRSRRPERARLKYRAREQPDGTVRIWLYDPDVI